MFTLVKWLKLFLYISIKLVNRQSVRRCLTLSWQKRLKWFSHCGTLSTDVTNLLQYTSSNCCTLRKRDNNTYCMKIFFYLWNSRNCCFECGERERKRERERERREMERIGICRTSHRPDECGTRPCFRWVQAQSRSPETLEKGAPLARGNKPSPFKEG